MIRRLVEKSLPLAGIPVIDCHIHVGQWSLMYLPAPDADAVVATMDRLGIDIACVSPLIGSISNGSQGNEVLIRELRRHPDRFLGMVVFDPNRPAQSLADLQRCDEEHGMRLIKIHPYCHARPADGPEYREMWGYAARREMIVLTHTWESDPTCSPEMFDSIARQYPGAKIILGHSGGTVRGCEQALRVVGHRANVYLDTSSSQPHFGMLERFVREVGADRVLFGSDISILDAAAQIGRIAYADISEDEKAKILGLNMMRLLGVDTLADVLRAPRADGGVP